MQLSKNIKLYFPALVFAELWRLKKFMKFPDVDAASSEVGTG